MKGCLKVVIAFSLVVLVLLLPTAYAAIKRYQLDHADHLRIVSACREAIANRASYRIGNSGPLAKQEEIHLDPPFPKDFPDAIRKLRPSRITITEDSILINFFTPFARTTILGFRRDARQHGTFRYIDGLWFWNGNDITRPAEETLP